MAVKIRLKRLGKIRAPYYRIVVADSRTKRDGRVIEEIGKYHPTEHPSVIEVKSERAQYWLGVGAQPTEQVKALLKLTGDWGTFKGEKGAKSTVQFAEPKPEFQPDAKKKPVLRPKTEKKAEPKPAQAEAASEDAPEVAEAPADAPAEAPAEAAVEAPADAPSDEAPVADEAPAVAEEAPAEAEEAPASEEVPAEEAPAEEAPAEEAPAVAEEAPAAEDADKKDDN